MTNSVLDAIGNTPLIQLEEGIWAKCEFMNPSGSIKARMAKYMIERAEKEQPAQVPDAVVLPGVELPTHFDLARRLQRRAHEDAEQRSAGLPSPEHQGRHHQEGRRSHRAANPSSISPTRS